MPQKVHTGFIRSYDTSLLIDLFLLTTCHWRQQATGIFTSPRSVFVLSLPENLAAWSKGVCQCFLFPGLSSVCNSGRYLVFRQGHAWTRQRRDSVAYRRKVRAGKEQRSKDLMRDVRYARRSGNPRRLEACCVLACALVRVLHLCLIECALG